MPGKQFVLDTFAVMAFFNRETGHEIVRGILEEGMVGQAQAFMSEINLGEFYYMTVKKLNRAKADARLKYIRRVRLTLIPVTHQRVMEAAEFKIKYSTAKNQISFADCFAASLAHELSAQLVTGDPEFIAIEPDVNILWIK